MTSVVWKTIKGNSDYEVSSEGEVRSSKHRKTIILKPCLDTAGYLYVVLYQNGRRKNYIIHRLVLSAFISKCPEGKEANHLDGDKCNNRLENIEWVTRSENHLHAFRTGLKVPHSGGTDKPVRQLSKIGEFVKTFQSAYDAFRKTGINRGNISSCCTGRRKSVGGYRWQFADGK